MADLVIRGMEIPKERNLWFCIKTDGAVYDIGTAHAVGTAIQLPEGHGDLINRKKLDLVPDYKSVRNGIKRIVKETKRDGRTIAGISIELLEQTLVALDELRSVRRYFENAKTIVPAEEGTDNG